MNNKPLGYIDIDGKKIEKGTELFRARILPSVGVCCTQVLTVRTIYNDALFGMDVLSGITYMVKLEDLEVNTFFTRQQADKLVKDTQKSGKIRLFEKGKDDNNNE